MKKHWFIFGMYGIAYSLLVKVLIIFSSPFISFLAGVLYILDPGYLISTSILSTTSELIYLSQNGSYIPEYSRIIMQALSFLFNSITIDFVIGAIIGLRISSVREGTYKGSKIQKVVRALIVLVLFVYVFTIFFAGPLSRYLHDIKYEQLLETQKSIPRVPSI